MDNNIFTNENLQGVITAISSNAEAIDALRRREDGMNLDEAAELFLMDKYKLSQTEAADIVDGLSCGMSKYREAYGKVSENYEETIRKSVNDSLENMNDKERMKYLSSMLTLLEAASKPDCDKSVIDDLMKKNSARTQEELVDEIVGAMNGLSLDLVASMAKEVNMASVASLAEAIEKNSEDYRFMVAVQLYVIQRDKQLKLDGVMITNLEPEMLGALSSATVDAMLATADLQNGKITLKRWQQILKYILGAVFVVASIYFMVMILTSASVAIMLSILGVIGTSIAAIILSFVVIIPVLKYGADFTIKNIMLLLEKLSPIYDKVVTVCTSCVASAFSAAIAWVKGFLKNDCKEEEASGQSRSDTDNASANTANAPSPALA